MAYDKRKMQDIKFSEKDLLTEYKALYAEGDFDGIADLMQDNPDLKYKIMDSYNWNRMLNLVHDGTNWTSGAQGEITTDATNDSLIGQFASDYNDLLSASEYSIYKLKWSLGAAYKKNNLVKYDDYHSYYCIQNHTASTSNAPPNASYWVQADGVVGILGMPISGVMPSNAIEGDVWLAPIDNAKTINFNYPRAGTVSITLGGDAVTPGDVINTGDVLSITITPDTPILGSQGVFAVANVTINGQSQTLPTAGQPFTQTITVGTDSIEINSIIAPSTQIAFADASWQFISNAVRRGYADMFGWQVGDLKEITYGSKNINVRIVDMTPGRYNIDTLDGYRSNMVIATEECVAALFMMNRSDGIVAPLGRNIYGWNEGTLGFSNLQSYISRLEQDLANILRPTYILSAQGTGRDRPVAGAWCKVFLPSESEMFGTTEFSSPGEGTIFQYYVNLPSSAKRIKLYNGSPTEWWLRSADIGTNNKFCTVTPSGELMSEYAIFPGHVPLFFAI